MIWKFFQFIISAWRLLDPPIALWDWRWWDFTSIFLSNEFMTSFQNSTWDFLVRFFKWYFRQKKLYIYIYIEIWKHLRDGRKVAHTKLMMNWNCSLKNHFSSEYKQPLLIVNLYFLHIIVNNIHSKYFACWQFSNYYDFLLSYLVRQTCPF